MLYKIKTKKRNKIMDKEYVATLDNEALLNVFRGTCMSSAGLQDLFVVEAEILKIVGLTTRLSPSLRSFSASTVLLGLHKIWI